MIVEALDALPDSLDAETRAKAEAHLISEAGHYGPRELKRLGLGLLEVVAPEIADEAEYQRLLAEEKRSRAETRLNIRDRGDGTSDITARIPTPDAHRFRTYLDAYTSPRRHRSAIRWVTSTSSRCRDVAVRRSAPCWRTSPSPAFRSTAAPPPA